MDQNPNTEHVKEIMLDFARITGIEPASNHPKRYLWTDAFAVCNYLELFHLTEDKSYQDLALRLVDQVHHTLGRHRDDDMRSGWISGLNEQEGRKHPTKGGLRIGKKLPERKPNEPFDERMEWDQDGQYYHYLTKWMHALNRVGNVTGDSTYTIWAIELAQTVHSRFTYLPSDGQKRMYWKMSIDLTYPLVPSMGQHDPLDGFLTYSELQMATRNFEHFLQLDLSAEISDIANICQGMNWSTNDPLGIGGLLSDASRTTQLIIRGGFSYTDLLEAIVDSALFGIESFSGGNSLEFPAKYRLAFRELGLSIGLKGIEKIMRWINENPNLFSENSSLQRRVESLIGYVSLSKIIEQFWMDSVNREASGWTEHQEINMVMLATSLAPEGFLMI